MLSQIVRAPARFFRGIGLRPSPPRDSHKREHHWSIGICSGKSPFDFSTTMSGAANPVLTYADVKDISASFVADPFMLLVDRRWFMFFEAVNTRSRKGEIAVAESVDCIKWRYRAVVLQEDFHLSYPYVFEWDGQYYMIPESHRANAVRLYCARQFPFEWEFVGNLLEGQLYVDPSIFRFDDRWWLFVTPEPEFKSDTLLLYYAYELTGPWVAHPSNPIVEGNAHIARPAGRVLAFEDRVIRYTQDCVGVYGNMVRAFEINELTSTRYHETIRPENPMLSGSGSGWNSDGMHHVDAHLIEEDRWIACVDGFRWREA